MAWNSEESNVNLITRALAIDAIKEKARAEGHTKFRVNYNGSEVEPQDLPDMVDMNLVSISAMLNNA